jgi:hypothetical protein
MVRLFHDFSQSTTDATSRSVSDHDAKCTHNDNASPQKALPNAITTIMNLFASCARSLPQTRGVVLERSLNETVAIGLLTSDNRFHAVRLLSSLHTV